MQLPNVKRRARGNFSSCGSIQARSAWQSSITFAVVDRSFGCTVLTGKLAKHRPGAFVADAGPSKAWQFSTDLGVLARLFADFQGYPVPRQLAVQALWQPTASQNSPDSALSSSI